ncbi:MAG: dTDP-4-amino-4,6-dideoxygalactose transaminase [Bacteroidota bacterium]|nr:dTDP-4-amino-4,6-dideoxygalactose transaminase [Bacteroidota bacterium]
MTENNPKIPLHRPHHSPNGQKYVSDAFLSDRRNYGGPYTKQCEQWFSKYLNIESCYFTNSCSAALEMCALLLDLKKGDEVIVPSYTYVTTASVFLLHGAIIRFADCIPQRPNVGIETIEKLVNSNTKAIVVVHYGGIPVEMESIRQLCAEYKLVLIEDAAHAFGSRYHTKLLGSFSDLATFSFHDTKIICCGEGGLLCINNPSFNNRAECIIEKGTNKIQFSKSMVTKYEWVDVGASYGNSEFHAAAIQSNLEDFDTILKYRIAIFNLYLKYLRDTNLQDFIEVPSIAEGASINGSIFYIQLKDKFSRDSLMHYLNFHGIEARFHYIALHRSPYILSKFPALSVINENSTQFENTLLRLPIHTHITETNVDFIVSHIQNFFTSLK